MHGVKGYKRAMAFVGRLDNTMTLRRRGVANHTGTRAYVPIWVTLWGVHDG